MITAAKLQLLVKEAPERILAEERARAERQRIQRTKDIMQLEAEAVKWCNDQFAILELAATNGSYDYNTCFILTWNPSLPVKESFEHTAQAIRKQFYDTGISVVIVPAVHDDDGTMEYSIMRLNFNWMPEDNL